MNRPLRLPPAFVLAPALFAAGVIATAGAASAAQSFDVPAWGEARSARVHYADLDLSTPSGVQRLERRIAYAIEQVCALPHAEQLGQRSRVVECKAEARRQADASSAQLHRQRQDALARRN